MSTTVNTAQQASFSTDHIFGHPGSTFAGIGTMMLGVSSAIQQGGLPTSTAGWVTFGLSFLGGLLGMLGK